MFRASALLALCSIHCLFLGCSKEESKEGKRHIYTSAHFEYSAAVSDTEVCEDILQTLEGHYAALRDYLGFAELTEKIRYHKYENVAALTRARACSPGNQSCYFADRGIFTTQALEMHELVHAYLAPYGDRHQLLEEGLAQALSCAERPEQVTSPLPLRDALDPKFWSDATPAKLRQLYQLGSVFVSYLLREHGPEKFVDLYQRVERFDNLSKAATHFEAVYARPLAEAWQEAVSDPAPGAACVRVWECDDTFLVHAPRESERMVLDGKGKSCDASDRFRTFETDEPRWLQLPSPVGGLLLGSCQAEPMVHDSFLRPNQTGQDGEFFGLAVPPGRYFSALGPTSKQAVIHAQNIASYVGSAENCKTLEVVNTSIELEATFALADSVLSSLTARRQAAVLLWQDEHFATGRYHVTCSQDLRVEACAQCDSATCRSVCDTNVAVGPEFGGEGPLVLQLNGPVDRSEKAAHWLRFRRLKD